MLLNLYEVIYIACIDVSYNQFFVVWFQHVVHKTLQVASWDIFLDLRPPHSGYKELRPLPFSHPPPPSIINDRSLNIQTSIFFSKVNFLCKKIT